MQNRNTSETDCEKKKLETRLSNNMRMSFQLRGSNLLTTFRYERLLPCLPRRKV